MLVHFISDFPEKIGHNEASVLEAENRSAVKICEAKEDFEKVCLDLASKYSSNAVKSKISDDNRFTIISSCINGIKWLKGSSDVNLLAIMAILHTFVRWVTSR